MNYLSTERVIPAPEPTAEQWIDLRAIWAAVWRRRRLFVAACAFAALIAFAIGMLQPRLYTATSLMLIGANGEQVMAPSQGTPVRPVDSAAVDSAVEVLNSSRLAAQIARQIHLKVHVDPGPIGAVLQQAGLGPRSMPDPQEAAANFIAEALIAKRRAQSNAIEIAVEMHDPALATRVANAAFSAYQTLARDARVASQQTASAWLAARLGALRSEVQTKEAAVESYRASTGLLTANGVSLSEQQIANIQNEALEARADLAQKESQYRNLHDLMNTHRSADTTAAALVSPVIAQLRAREAALAEQQAQLEMRYSDQHPAVQNGRAELSSVRHQIDAEVARIAAGLQNDASIARARVGILEGTLAQARGELVSNNAEVVRLNELEREAAASRSVYESYLQRQQELSQQGLLGDGDARLVSSATLPTDPSSPHVFALLIAALLIGLAGAGVAVLVSEQLDNTIHTATDAQRALGPGIRTVASLPIIRAHTLRLLGPASRNPAGYILKKPASGFAESIRMLRTSALLALGGEGKQVLAITSAMPNEGKSTTALSLARVCAKSYARVLLIDCDVRRHSLNALLGIRPKTGLLAVISGRADWQNVVGVDEQSGAHVLPVEEEDSFLDWTSSPRWSALLQELRDAYDLIVLDCPPILALAESRKLAMMADGVVVIARAGQTPAPAVRATCEQLSEVGANVIGVALNGIDPAAPGRFSYQETLYYAGAMQRYYAD